jgi:hypothetical protein
MAWVFLWVGAGWGTWCEGRVVFEGCLCVMA